VEQFVERRDQFIGGNSGHRSEAWQRSNGVERGKRRRCKYASKKRVNSLLL
jgi:hypothetical protein